MCGCVCWSESCLCERECCSGKRLAMLTADRHAEFEEDGEIEYERRERLGWRSGVWRWQETVSHCGEGSRAQGWQRC